jgi:hypothetical protein
LLHPQILSLEAVPFKGGRSTRRFVVDQEERELCEMIHELRQQGMAIEQIALWLMRQTEYPCKRRLDNCKAVEWAVAAKELGFPKQTDGKRMVKERLFKKRHGGRA